MARRFDYWLGVVSVLALLQAPAVLAAQSELRVAVSAEGVALAGARVSVGGESRITGAEGQASFRLSAGEHRMRVEHIGHRSVARTVWLRAGLDTLVRVELEPEVVAGEAIVVTSTRSERRLEDEPLRVEVVGSEEIGEKLLMSPGDISMLLNETSGVRVQPLAGALGGAGIRIQGLSGRYTQLLVDGLPLHGAQPPALGALQIAPLDLRQVEVIKGPASALYGASALGGVVNLVSRRPDGIREVLYNQTSLGGRDALVHWSGPAGGLSYTLLAGLHAQRMEDLDDDNWADVPEHRRLTLRPRVFWQGERGSTLLVTAGTTWEKREGGTPLGLRLKNNVQYRERQETRRLDGGLNGRWALGERTWLRVRLAAARERAERRLHTARLDDARSTALVEGAVQVVTGAHDWLVGAALERDSYDAYDLPLLDQRFTAPALFAQDEFRALDWLVLAGSARLDFHSEYGTLFNPRLSALFRPGPWSLRLSAGTGSFAPGPFTEVTEAVGVRNLRPLSGLEAERARSVSFDAGRLFGPLELNGSLYAARVADPVRTRVPATNQLELVNAAGPVRSRGAELFARARLGAVHATVTYAWQDVTEAHPDSAGRRREVPLTPRHGAGLVASWEYGESVRVGAEAYYVGEQVLEDNPFRARSRPYWLTGVLAEFRLGRVRVFLNGENLGDVRQTRTDPLVRPTRSREGLWTTAVWAPLEGRTLNGGLRVLLGH